MPYEVGVTGFEPVTNAVNIAYFLGLWNPCCISCCILFFIDELNRKFVFKRRNSSEVGICTPHYIMIMGTSVLQGANADYRQLFLASDLLSKLKFYDPSISNFVSSKCVITTNNGDGNAATIHYYAPEWWESNNAYYQYFYPATSAPIRVNYCIHYINDSL